jgi:ABC-type spermidine/putrescine transport system permease subunit II
MNRAFLIIVIPALLVAAGYVFVIRYIGVQLTYLRFVMAGLGFIVVIGFVRMYLRRHPRRPNN